LAEGDEGGGNGSGFFRPFPLLLAGGRRLPGLGL